MATCPAELGLCLLPERAFLSRRDGVGPGVRRAGEGSLVKGRCDAFGDELREQGGAEAWARADPDAVADLVGQVTRKPEGKSLSQADLRCRPECDRDARGLRVGEPEVAGFAGSDHLAAHG